jgi:hypothetical protein
MKSINIKMSDLKCHEKVIPEKCYELYDYITADPTNINTIIDLLPRIIIDISTNVIIDGHHRYRVFQDLHISTIPVLAVDYINDTNIRIYPSNTNITKENVISAALNNQLYEPKTTKHMIINELGELLPIIDLVSHI